MRQLKVSEPLSHPAIAEQLVALGQRKTRESAEAAAGDLEAHEAAANPHPGYLTPAEGDAAYDALGAAAAAQAASVPKALPSSVTPSNNGDIAFELTSNTILTIRVKGSDGVVRSETLVLA